MLALLGVERGRPLVRVSGVAVLLALLFLEVVFTPINNKVKVTSQSYYKLIQASHRNTPTAILLNKSAAKTTCVLLLRTFASGVGTYS